MKKTLLFLAIFVIVSMACDLSVTVVPTSNPAPLPTSTSIPAATSIPVTSITEATVVPAATLPPAFDGAEVAVDPLHIVIPTGLASGARGTQFTRAEGDDLPYFEVTPGHIVLTVEGYVLPNRFHEPQIYVYPAQEYAEMVPPAFESMHRLNNILANPNASIPADQLPTVPFFNAAQAFASSPQIAEFFGQLFDGPPDVTMWVSSGWNEW